ncbi:MAG: hypothetical protein AUH85_13520 [Chloroflexi bacterium 13_1_40CM_4_68_4]|nr:MAG: hypothetical protein AUH85_13520 [Chloroflexi bacterium 13_1_40CM_4_68_4]
MVALIAASVVVFACGSHIPASRSPSPSPTALTGPGVFVLVASTLHSYPSPSGNSAVGGEDACSGSATVTIDPNPRGQLNLAVARFEITLFGCPPGTTITSVHLHRLPIGNLEEWIGSTNQGVPLARAQAVIAEPTAWYIHFHSKNNVVGGFLRGELVPR